jgi:hypothetical protein
MEHYYTPFNFIEDVYRSMKNIAPNNNQEILSVIVSGLKLLNLSMEEVFRTALTQRGNESNLVIICDIIGHTSLIESLDILDTIYPQIMLTELLMADNFYDRIRLHMIAKVLWQRMNTNLKDELRPQLRKLAVRDIETLEYTAMNDKHLNFLLELLLV